MKMFKNSLFLLNYVVILCYIYLTSIRCVHIYIVLIIILRCNFYVSLKSNIKLTWNLRLKYYFFCCFVSVNNYINRDYASVVLLLDAKIAILDFFNIACIRARMLVVRGA